MSKYAIITGSSRGLGAATLVQLAKDGFNVVGTYVSDSSKDKMEAVLKKARAYGVKAEGFQCNIGEYDECKKLIDFSVSTFGTELAALINNAGSPGATFFMQETRETYERDIRVNMIGHLHLTHLVLPYMADNKDGSIVCISSIAGVMGTPTQVAYGTSKAGLIGFAKGLSREVAHLNIRINCVAPGAMDTDIMANAPKDSVDATMAMIPMGRMGTPQDIADCVSYLVHSTYVTGQTISVNGGMYA